MKRSSGILLPISSLPGKYGIGTLGKTAYEFADRLKEAGQTYWQILPVGPTSYGDSPYSSFSAYAGNPYFIDPETLLEKGYLKEEEIPQQKNDPAWIDYSFLYNTRFEMLKKASKQAYKEEGQLIRDFCAEENWLDPYARFMSLKAVNGMKAPAEWTVTEYDGSMKDLYDLYVYIQYEFFRQWKAFKEYVNSLGLKLIGDIPIYVASDSADVWQDPDSFWLDEENNPVKVSGVPPDYFSEEGQLWGNPLYDYKKMRDSGYGWWIRRIGQACRLYDVIRIDHFRGFSTYWAVPYGEKTAKAGQWMDGPGMDLVGRLLKWFSGTEFIAEDLGVLTPDVTQLLKDSGLPGMKVLQFAFGGDPDNLHLPHNHTENSVCYTGTHDNATLAEWLSEDKESLKMVRAYLGIGNRTDPCEALLRTGMASVSRLFVAPVQDWMHLGKEARINTPGTTFGNWTWCMTEQQMEAFPVEHIREMTRMYGRLTSPERIVMIKS